MLPWLAAGLDFVSIGTNDLAQYTAAADRGSHAVAELADPLGPAVLQLVDLVNRTRPAAVTVSVCGDLASWPEAVPLLLGLGVDELSCRPPAVPVVKAAVRRPSLAGPVSSPLRPGVLRTRPGYALCWRRTARGKPRCVFAESGIFPRRVGVEQTSDSASDAPYHLRGDDRVGRGTGAGRGNRRGSRGQPAVRGPARPVLLAGHDSRDAAPPTTRRARRWLESPPPRKPMALRSAPAPSYFRKVSATPGFRHFPAVCRQFRSGSAAVVTEPLPERALVG